ncbi:hypothetical protein POUND7_012995 [Theobroma cacao]
MHFGVTSCVSPTFLLYSLYTVFILFVPSFLPSKAKRHRNCRYASRNFSKALSLGELIKAITQFSTTNFSLNRDKLVCFLISWSLSLSDSSPCSNGVLFFSHFLLMKFQLLI